MAHPSNGAHFQGRHPELALILISALGLGGCGRIERAQECQALVATVNPALDAIEARQVSGADRRAAMRDAARRYERLASRVTRLRFTNTGLGKTVREYADVLRHAARAARSVAAALERGNLGALTRARAEMASVARKEKALAKRLDKMCHGP